VRAFRVFGVTRGGELLALVVPSSQRTMKCKVRGAGCLTVLTLCYYMAWHCRYGQRMWWCVKELANGLQAAFVWFVCAAPCTSGRLDLVNLCMLLFLHCSGCEVHTMSCSSCVLLPVLCLHQMLSPSPCFGLCDLCPASAAAADSTAARLYSGCR
jgi:hypothetical protein